MREAFQNESFSYLLLKNQNELPVFLKVFNVISIAFQIILFSFVRIN